MAMDSYAKKNYTSIMKEILKNISFNSDGLVPVIAQQFDSGEVLMLAWMNEEAIKETLETKRVCYWSRSRQSLWRKGETSGQSQYLKELIIDCDGDTLLALVDQEGVACHTGRRSCFFNKIEGKGIAINRHAEIAPEVLYKK